MTLLKHELKQGKIALLIWTVVVAFMLAVCILIYPEMKDQMNQMSDLFANMGSFSSAFGMDQIQYGEFIGFFSTECGNMLGLGGAFFAALLGISILAKEERGKTADFLFTHPMSRRSILAAKLGAVLIQIFVFNIAVILISLFFIRMIGETPDRQTLFLLFLSYFILQLEIAAICFGISAFIRRGGLGIGLGLAALFYFLNIISNLVDGAKFLKYITPFGYADGVYIIPHNSINTEYLLSGILLAGIGLAAGWIWYSRKDIL